jgi:hypothetical protein
MATHPSVWEGERCWLRVLSTLNERQARLFVAQRALELGRSGISQVSRLTGMSRPAIYRGIDELRSQRAWKRASAGGRRTKAGGDGGVFAQHEPGSARQPLGLLRQ